MRVESQAVWLLYFAVNDCVVIARATGKFCPAYVLGCAMLSCFGIKYKSIICSMIGSVNLLGLYFLLHIAEELKPSDCTARMLLLYENAFCERFFKVSVCCLSPSRKR